MHHMASPSLPFLSFSLPLLFLPLDFSRLYILIHMPDISMITHSFSARVDIYRGLVALTS